MYQALITPIQAILPHPNADKLEIAVVCNTHVVVGIGNYKQDDLIIFFETDGCLSQPYCEANGLYEKFEEIDGVKTRIGTGYLDPNGRVRALNLRSYKSIGLVESLSLQSTFPNQFPEGVVVRVDHAGKTWFLKEKNWYFLAMEGFMKDKPDYVDTEEVEA